MCRITLSYGITNPYVPTLSPSPSPSLCLCLSPPQPQFHSVGRVSFQPLVVGEIWSKGNEWQWNILVCHHRLLCLKEKEPSVPSRIFPSLVTLLPVPHPHCLTLLSSPAHLKSVLPRNFPCDSCLLLLWDFPFSWFPHPCPLCLQCRCQSNCLRSVLLSHVLLSREEARGAPPEASYAFRGRSNLSLLLASSVSLSLVKGRKITWFQERKISSFRNYLKQKLKNVQTL